MGGSIPPQLQMLKTLNMFIRNKKTNDCVHMLDSAAKPLIRRGTHELVIVSEVSSILDIDSIENDIEVVEDVKPKRKKK